MFFNTEQRENSRIFDHLVEGSNALLQNPAFVQTIGSSATEALLVQLNNIFLPNLRHGELSLPRRERSSQRTAVVPLTDEQADRVGRFTNPLFDAFVIPHSTSQTNSEFYDLTLNDEARGLLAKHRDMDASTRPQFPDVKLGDNVAAAARTLWIATDNKKRTLSSRSVVVIRHADARDQYAAGRFLHEFVHVDDTKRDGPLLYCTDPYGISSESRGYQVSAFTGHPFSVAVENVRRQTADSSRPFAPTPELRQIIYQTT